MLDILLSRQAGKFLTKLPPKYKRQVSQKIQTLQSIPFPNDSKLLKGHASFYRVDIGEFRIIYKLNDEKDVLFIAIIGKRNDAHVYKVLKRQVR